MVSDEQILKIGVQNVQVYRDFVEKPNGLDVVDAYNMMLASVIGAYHLDVRLSDLINGLAAQVEALQDIAEGIENAESIQGSTVQEENVDSV